MSSSQPRVQPQPPPSPPHHQSRRSSAKAARLVRCSLKSKTASTNSVCKTGDGSDATTTQAALVLRDQQKPPEPRTTCTLGQPSKNRRTVKDEDTHFDGKGDHSLLCGTSPEEQAKGEELALGGLQEQLPGGSCDGASHTSKPEVRDPPRSTHPSRLDVSEAAGKSEFGPGF